MNSNSSLPPDRGPLSEADERVIDALVGEVLEQAPSPPDLTSIILQQYAALGVRPDVSLDDTGQSDFPSTDVDHRNSQKTRNGTPIRRRRWSVWVLAASSVALAASVMLIVTRLSIFDQPGSGVIANADGSKASTKDGSGAGVPTGRNDLSGRNSVGTGPEQIKNTTELARKPPRQGVPMIRQDSENRMVAESKPSEPGREAEVQSIVSGGANVSLVRFNETMSKYWQNVGVTPTTELSDEAFATRIERRFGFRPVVSKGQPFAQDVFEAPEACSELASRLIDRLFQDVPLVDGARDKMVVEATHAIARGNGFDLLVAGWLGNERLFDRSVPQRLSQSLAANLLDADVRCAKCHDSPVDGRLGQHDYWAFASVFAPSDRGPLFYELNDGRQKIAEAGLPKRWFSEGDSDNAKSSGDDASATKSLQKQFADSLVGSHSLAGAIANRLWEVGFGASLVPRASAPIAPPRDDSLQKAHAELSSLLIASRFDVKAAAQVVVSSVAMRRGESELVQTGRWQMADESAIEADSLLVRSFAAAPAAAVRVRRDQLLAMMASRIGHSPKDLGSADTLLAQPIIEGAVKPNENAKPKAPSVEEQLWASWVAERPLLRESWLHWIKDNEEQRRHVYYSVGMVEPSDKTPGVEKLTSPSDESEVAKFEANDRLLWVLMQTR